MNEYEKGFVEAIARLKILPGPEFATLTKAALERAVGGEEESLLEGVSQATIEDPAKLAAQLLGSYGDGAVQYLTMIVRYAESGEFHPEEDEELEKEEEELESVIEETGSGEAGPASPAD